MGWNAVHSVLLRPVYTSQKKWNSSDKEWNGSVKFLRINDTWPVPVLPVQLKKGSIGAYGRFSDRTG